MVKKPTQYELNAHKIMQKDPDFGKNVLRTIINETPELKASLLEAGLVYEVKEK